MIPFANLLTLHSDIQTFAEYTVAPYMGAWIETAIFLNILKKYSVAPYMGAWIETLNNVLAQETKASHPIWVRGLKREYSRTARIAHLCRTLYGCVD